MQQKSDNLELPCAVIFDWDNTLVDTGALIDEAINITMAQMGRKNFSSEEIKNTSHRSMREYFPSLFGKDWQKAGDIYKNTYSSTKFQKLKLFPDAEKLIDYLHQKNILLFIISNKMGNVLREEVEYFGIRNKFFSVIGAMDAEEDKPSKKVVELALMGSDIDPKQDLVWFIGDTITDMECAYNSACQPILFGEVGESGESDNLFIAALKEKMQKNKPLLNFKTHQKILDYIINELQI